MSAYHRHGKLRPRRDAEVIEVSDDDDDGKRRPSSPLTSPRLTSPRVRAPSGGRMWLSLLLPKHPRVVFNERTGWTCVAPTNQQSQQQSVEVDAAGRALLESGNAWLNDAVINGFLQCNKAELMSVSGPPPTVVVLSSFFFSRVVQHHSLKSMPLCATRMIHWVDEVFFERSDEGSSFSPRSGVLRALGAANGDVSSGADASHVTVVIPVNDQSRAHWVLVVLRLGGCSVPVEILVVDSLAPNPRCFRGFHVYATNSPLPNEEEDNILRCYVPVVRPVLSFFREVAKIHISHMKAYNSHPSRQRRLSNGFEGVGFVNKFHGVSFTPSTQSSATRWREGATVDRARSHSPKSLSSSSTDAVGPAKDAPPLWTVCGIPQGNGYDCGIHTLIAATYVLEREAAASASTPPASESAPWSHLVAKGLQVKYSSVSRESGRLESGRGAALAFRGKVLRYLTAKAHGGSAGRKTNPQF